MSITPAELRSEDFLLNIINSINDPVFVKDKKHIWVLLNNAFCQFVGHTSKELLGKSDYDFFPKDQADIFWQKDEEVLKTDKTNINEETITDAKSNMKVIVTKKAVYTDTLGKKYIIGVINDITEIKQNEMNNKLLAEELEKLKRIMITREQTMNELKKESDTLKQRLEKCEKNVLF